MGKLALKIYHVSTTFLLGLLVTGTVIASQNSTAISNALGSETFRVETTGEVGDTEYFKSKYKSLAELIEAGRDLVEEVEGEGAVLLKNDKNALPLAKGSKISLFSVSSVNPAYGGRGSAQTSFPQTPVTPKEGFENAGFVVNNELNEFYLANKAKYSSTGRGDQAVVNDAPWSDITSTAGLSTSIENHSDAAFFIVTRVGGEGSDLASTGVKDGTDGDHLKLSVNERSVLKGLKALKDQGVVKKIVVLINASNQIQSDYLIDPELGVDAAMWIGSVGVTGFNAVGKLVSGEITPSGHLSDAHWYNHKDNPVSKNFGAYTYNGADNFDMPMLGSTMDTKYSKYDVYQEGVYVGYRYAETRYADVVTKRAKAGTFSYKDIISHPFGYGGSYTNFEFSNFKAEKVNNTYEISVDVQNIGATYSGKDVVQVYVQKPYTSFDIERGIEKPAVELVGFAKTSVLAPNAKETVKVVVDESEFRVYDANVDKTYIITEGDYHLTAATDAHNAINNILAYQNHSGLDGEGNKDMVAKYSLKYNNTTYSKSSKTGEKITNLFDEADINKYSGKGKNAVTYVSRNDWEGTLPTKTATVSMTSQLLKDLLAQDDPSKNIVQDNIEYPTYGAENGLKLIDLRVDADENKVSYNNPIWDKFLDQLTWEETSALLSNGLRQTAVLDRLGKPKTVDHNGPAGLTQRYNENPFGLAKRSEDPDGNKTAPYYPCAGIIAASFNTEIAKKFGDMLGEDAIWAGYAGFYGIAINTHRSPYEGRAYEYFSEDPFLAGLIATEEVKALQSHGCNAYIKHFALNEQETCRNGVSIWLNEQSLREIYLRPFEKTVVDGDASNAMASFTRIGAKYCPASRELITDFLRGELGMSGLVVTDMYSIGYRTAHMPTFMMAGTDIPDGELNKDKPYEPYKENYGAFANQMREAAKRILYSTVHSNAMNGLSSNTRLVAITPDWMLALIRVDSVIGVLWILGVASAVVAAVKKTTKEEN